MAITTYIVDSVGPAQITPVYLLSGSVAVNLNPGDIHIGDVGIVDEVTGLKTQVEYADTPKSPTVNTLLVQSVDTNGEVISKALIDFIHQDVELIQTYQGMQIGQLNAIVQAGTDTLTETINVYNTVAAINAQAVSSNTKLAAIQDSGTRVQNLLTNGNSTMSTVAMNTENTIVAIDEQTAVLRAILNEQGTENLKPTNAILTIVMNGQGTLATHADAQSVNATLGAGNAILTAILNDMGTLATAANQVASTNVVGSSNSILTAIMNGQGTLSTHSDSMSIAQASGEISSQLSGVISTRGISGTVAAHDLSVAIRLNTNDPATDAFGRLRVSNPDYRFDGQLTYGIPPEIWDTVWTSTGTITYDATNRTANIACAANATSTMQSHYYAPYTPGRSQMCFISFVLGSTPLIGTARRVGYYDGSNGVYLEQNFFNVTLNVASTTSNGLESVTQSNWNIDKMDGTGPSAVTLDLTKVQILVIYLQALYSGRVIVGFDINGNIYPVHQFNHANVVSKPYLAEASLPIHYEASSTGSNTTSLNAICASVISEGGGNLADIPGRTFSSARVTGATVSSRIPLLSIMPQKQFQGQNDHALILPVVLSAAMGNANQASYLEIVRNAKVNGAAWTAVDNSNSIALVDTSGTSITGGSTIYSTFCPGGSGGIPALDINSNTLARFICVYSQLLGASDTLSIVGQPTAANPTVSVALTWKEVR